MGNTVEVTLDVGGTPWLSGGGKRTRERDIRIEGGGKEAFIKGWRGSVNTAGEVGNHETTSKESISRGETGGEGERGQPLDLEQETKKNKESQGVKTIIRVVRRQMRGEEKGERKRTRGRTKKCEGGGGVGESITTGEGNKAKERAREGFFDRILFSDYLS